MRYRPAVLAVMSLLALACGDDDAGSSEPHADAGRHSSGSVVEDSLLALTYNVAGLPEGLSQSMPSRFTPMIGPLLNGYDLVFLQESWQTPDPNPLAPLRGYHEILVATADHPFKTLPAEQPFGNDPRRPSAQLSDGLNVFSRFELGETQHVAWNSCVETASDCLAFKGFSMTPATLADDVPVHLYDLHMEAGHSPEDDTARAAGIEQLIDFIRDHSQNVALIVGGDFNLETDSEPARSQLTHLLEATGLSDACTELSCDHPGSIDKFLFRSGGRVQLVAESWALQEEVFVSDRGEPLSDHAPLAVQFAWSAGSE